MPVPPPPAAYAKLGIKISATVAKDLRIIAFLQALNVKRMRDNVAPEEMFLVAMTDRTPGP
jgi:hypothetical protein